jgi:hyperosmotically inducible periplasmic protein
MRKTKPLLIMILLVVLACAVYYLYRFGWTAPKLSQLGQIFSSSDPTITSKVKSDLASSRLLTGYDVNVKTDDGVVTVAGQVPSEDLRSLAGEIARQTAGVKEVKNLMIVSADARPEGGNPRIQDLEIRTALLQALGKSPELVGKRIDVNVENQTVTLTGSVDTQQQRIIAEQIARISAGVTSVNDAIAVAGLQPGVSQPSPAPAAGAAVEPNADLAKHVEFELYSTGAFDLSTVNIKADNGGITLTGTVRSRAEQLLAERVARGVAGVKTVTNDLKVAANSSRH